MSQKSHNAERECIARLLQALLREQLLSVTKDNNHYIISLPKSSAALKLENLIISLLSHFQIKGNVFYLENSKAQPQLITNSAQLLNILEKELADTLNRQQWQRFTAEIKNHIANTLLAEENNKRYQEILASAMKKSGIDNFYEWILKQNLLDKSLFFEQWVTQGHPYHPCSKTKLGLSSEEVKQYSPEFHQQTNIYIAAIHHDVIHIESMNNDPHYTEWFFKCFPKIKSLWLNTLKSNGIDPKQYVPIPIHPWQATHQIHTLFKKLMDSNKLFISHDVMLPTNPTLSFRTVAPTCNALQPHIKLPVAIQTTSAVRTVSPASTENGPKISYFLHEILEQENYFNETLRFMPEIFGLHVTGFDDETSKHLSAIFRENVNSQLKDGEMAIVVAALFEPTPIKHTPLLIEIIEFAGVKNYQSAANYFRRYVNIILKSYLDLYLLYGIALEAHQQNTIATFRQGELVATIARDFGGLRLYLPTFEEKGFKLTPYPGSATLRKNRDEVRNKLLHTTYQYHLGEWIFYLSKYYNVPESCFWAIVKEVTEQRFTALRSRMKPAVWEQERQAILGKNWVLKALLKMRLDNVSSDYIYVPIENPLK